MALIKFKPEVLDNFNLSGKISVLNSAINNVKNSNKNIKTDKKSIQW
jgi:hypothetical protein